MSKAIIIGCARGMGMEVARLLSQQQYTLGLADQNINELNTVASTFPAKVYTREINVADHDNARHQLEQLINDMNGIDMFIYCAGIRHDKSTKWSSENDLYQVNAIGFAALAHCVFHYFLRNNIKGHIVALSSILAMQSFGFCIPYGATKFFIRGYLQGLRHQSAINNYGINITDIRPGFVNTTMLDNQQKLFWVSSPQKAAVQIVNAIHKKKKWAYVTKRWEIVGLFLKYLPQFVVNRVPVKTNRVATQAS